MSKRCPNCMELFPDNLNVCPHCGRINEGSADGHGFDQTDNMKICKQCGTKNENSAIFCTECGNNLTENFKGFEEFGPGFGDYPVYPEHDDSETGIAKKPWFIVVIVISALVFLFAFFNILIFANIVNVESVPALKSYQDFVYSIFDQDEQDPSPKDEPTTYIEEEETTTQKETTTLQSTTENPDNGSTVPAGKTKYIVNVGKGWDLHLRSEKSSKSTSLALISNGTKLVITKIENGWGYTTYAGKAGWVSMEFVISEEEAKTTTTKADVSAKKRNAEPISNLSKAAKAEKSSAKAPSYVEYYYEYAKSKLQDSGYTVVIKWGTPNNEKANLVESQSCSGNTVTLTVYSDVK